MNRQMVAVILVVLLGVQLALVAYFAGWFEGRPDSAASANGSGPEQLPAETVRRKELPAFFERLAAARKSGDPQLLAGCSDNDRWADEVVATVRRERGEVPPQLRRRLMGDLAGRSITQSLLPPWKEVRIDWQSWHELQAPGEVEILVRHRLDDGSDYHMRWWLKYSPTGWRYFDWEDRELDERFTASTAQVPALNAREVAQWGPAAAQLSLAEDTAQRGRLDDAAAKLALVAQIKFPPVLEAHRWLLSGLVALRRGKPANALEDFKKAESFRKPIPYIDRLRAEAYLGRGESGRALASLAEYTQRLGEDPRTACCRGVALMRLAELPRAVSAFRECGEADPGKDQRAGPLRTNGAQE